MFYVSGAPLGAKGICFYISGAPRGGKSTCFYVSGAPRGAKRTCFYVSGAPVGRPGGPNDNAPGEFTYVLIGSVAN